MLTKRNNRSWRFLNILVLGWICQHNEYYNECYNQYANAMILQSVYGCIIGSLMTSHPAKLLAWFRSLLKWPVATWVQHGWHGVNSLGGKKQAKKTPMPGTLAWRPLLCPQVEVASINTGCTNKNASMSGRFPLQTELKRCHGVSLMNSN